MTHNILVVEDEPRLLKLLRLSLESDGYNVIEATDGRSAMEVVRDRMPDLIILDLILPGDIDGYQLCEAIRGFSEVPIIMLTSCARESEKLRGFACGADDYVTKPFSYPELEARITAVLHRTAVSRSALGQAKFAVGQLKLDYLRRRVYVGDREVHLTPTEYKVLEYMAMNAGKVLLHEQILGKIWGPEYCDEYQYLRNYISNLRKKIEPDPATPRYILSKPGAGYLMADD